MLMKRIINYIREQGDPGVELREEDFDILKKFANIMEKKSLDDALSVKKLERELYGMEDVKRQVREIVDVMKYYKRRETVGLGKGSFHNVHLLIGAPGTAKTTVAKLMGNMMMEQNLLPGNRFTCVNGADLKGMFVGHTAPKVHRIFENNDIIMIDEAYALVARDGWDRGGDGFSQEAVAALITEIEEHGPEKLVLFAGYGGIDVDDKDNLMKGFIASNPGLKSRINSTVFFKSYTPDEMVEIVHILARTQQFSLTKSADEDLRAYFAERVRDRNFGNGREARSLLQNATIFAAKRTRDIKAVRSARNRLQAITASDIRQAIQRQRRSTAMQNGRQSAGGFGFMV
jgi:SpoVK/Ycf46/Vps4 family AAA+-type ATPase